MWKWGSKGKKRGGNADFYQFSPHGTIWFLSSRRKTLLMATRGCRNPLLCLPGSWLVKQKGNRQMLLWGHCWTPLQDREGGRGCGWPSVPFLWQWKAPARHHPCSIPMLGWAHSCSQNMLPSSHLFLIQLFLPITPVPPISIFATVTRPLHPSLAGVSHVWLLPLPDVFIPPFQPLIMYMSYEQRAQGILETMGKGSPPPAPRIFQCILRDKSFLLAISSEKLVYPPFPPYIINETTLMNISW